MLKTFVLSIFEWPLKTSFMVCDYWDSMAANSVVSGQIFPKLPKDAPYDILLQLAL